MARSLRTRCSQLSPFATASPVSVPSFLSPSIPPPYPVDISISLFCLFFISLCLSVFSLCLWFGLSCICLLLPLKCLSICLYHSVCQLWSYIHLPGFLFLSLLGLSSCLSLFPSLCPSLSLCVCVFSGCVNVCLSVSDN